jgi:S1-C subfamily serine protease
MILPRFARLSARTALRVSQWLALVVVTTCFVEALDAPRGVVALLADETQEVPCGGAAVVLTSDGLAVTLAEALPDSALKAGEGHALTVVLPGGLRRQATLVKRGSTTTAVTLKIADLPSSVVPLKLGDSAVGKVGDSVWTAGNAFGALEEDGASAMSRGIISGRYTIPADSPAVRGRGGRVLSEYRGEVFEIDAAVNDGNQGGAALDANGNLIGLVSLGSARARRLGTVVPMHLVMKDLALDLPVVRERVVNDSRTQALMRAAAKTAPGLVLVYLERSNGLGNPQSVPRPPRLVEEVPKSERERLQHWWDAYYHQQQMFFTDQAVTALVVDAKQGLLLTAASHLHGDSERGEVLLPSGSVPCRVLATNLPLDLALLKADGALKASEITFAESPQLAVGQGVAIVGRHVGDNGFTCTTGVVSTTTRRMAQNEAVFAQTDARANYGNLGGAVVDGLGAMVGMVVMLNPEADWGLNSGVALFVDSATITRALPRLKDGTSTKRAPIVGLGVQLKYLTEGRPTITGVTKDTGAAEAGIQAGDVLLKVDGFDAASHQAVSRALIRHHVGDKVEVVVERAGEQKTVAVEIRAFGDEM